jgi:hypothetical protein
LARRLLLPLLLLLLVVLLLLLLLLLIIIVHSTHARAKFNFSLSHARTLPPFATWFYRRELGVNETGL